MARESDEAARQSERELLDEIALLRILASLGTSIAVFSHEVRAAINAATARLVDIGEDARSAPEPWRGLCCNAIEPAVSAIERLGDQATFVEGYTSRSRRRERTPQPLHHVLETFVAAFRGLAERSSTRLEHRVDPSNLRTTDMARSELEAILINLLTNALKAVKRGAPERRVLITAEREDDQVVLRFQDTGCGIPEAIRDTLFEPFVTTSLASDSDLGIGTGLGLKIVHDITEANHGTLQLEAPDQGFSTCFEIRLPASNSEGDRND